MNSQTKDPSIRAYLDAIRAHLADVEAGERDELLDDLEQHLNEVAAEEDGSLEDRLGPPGDYAAELRVTAGIGLRPRPSVRFVARARDRLNRSRLANWLEELAEGPAVQGIRGSLRELRSAWLVLRGYLLAVGSAGVLTGTPWTLSGHTPLPRVLDNRLVGAAVVLCAVWASVKLGRRASHRPMARRVGVVVSALALLAGFVWLVGANPTPASVVQYLQPEHLQHPDGSPISNICPYAADGTPLERILLFDQDTHPITNTAPSGALPPVGALNVYPRDVMTRDDHLTGDLRPLTCPPLAAPGKDVREQDAGPGAGTEPETGHGAVDEPAAGGNPAGEEHLPE